MHLPQISIKLQYALLPCLKENCFSLSPGYKNFPTSAKELASAIHKLIPTDEYGLYHATCEGICSWADFTEEIFRLAGVKTEVEHISSEEYKRRFPDSAHRPAYSALDNYMFRVGTDIRFADWHDAIEEYIKNGV